MVQFTRTGADVGPLVALDSTGRVSLILPLRVGMYRSRRSTSPRPTTTPANRRLHTNGDPTRGRRLPGLKRLDKGGRSSTLLPSFVARRRRCGHRIDRFGMLSRRVRDHAVSARLSAATGLRANPEVPTSAPRVHELVARDACVSGTQWMRRPKDRQHRGDRQRLR